MKRDFWFAVGFAAGILLSLTIALVINLQPTIENDDGTIFVLSKTWVEKE